MKLDRLQVYKAELASKPSQEWGEVLFRLASEAGGPSKDWKDRDFDATKRELETIRLKLTIALGTLEVYADPGSFGVEELPEEIVHLAQTALGKIEKVTWLQENRPAEIR